MLLRDLIKFANSLDASGLKKEADAVDDIISGIKRLLSERSGKPADGSKSIDKSVPEEEGSDQIEIFGFTTSHFDICPKAVEAFKYLEKALGEDPNQSAKDLAVEAAELSDKLFQIEKNVIKSESVATVELDEAYGLFQKILYTVGSLSSQMEEPLLSRFDFLKGHIEKINSFKSKETKDEQE